MRDTIVRATWDDEAAEAVETPRPRPAEPDPEELLSRLRESSARLVRQARDRARVATGLPALDSLLAGWPAGKVAELLGPLSSGRTAVAVATVAAATRRGEVAAWVDLADAFDPTSAAAAGVDLERVLWVRPRTLEEAVRAAELVLATGGFAVVVVDAGGVAVRRPVERRGTLRLRLARAVERAGAVALALGERPWVGTIAGVTLTFGRGEPCWGGERGGPRWLAGTRLAARVARGGVGEAGRAAAIATGEAAAQPARRRAAGG